MVMAGLHKVLVKASRAQSGPGAAECWELNPAPDLPLRAHPAVYWPAPSLLHEPASENNIKAISLAATSIWSNCLLTCYGNNSCNKTKISKTMLITITIITIT